MKEIIFFIANEMEDWIIRECLLLVWKESTMLLTHFQTMWFLFQIELFLHIEKLNKIHLSD